MLPSASPYRRRFGTWEAALLAFGVTPEQVAERLTTKTTPRDPNPDGYAPPGLPNAELVPVGGSAVGELNAPGVQRLVEAWLKLPVRSRYILTVRLGLGGADVRGLKARMSRSSWNFVTAILE